MSLNWEVIAEKVSEGVAVLAPIVSAAFPEAAVAAGIINKVVQGLMAAEPTAVALVKQIQSGAPATPDQLAQFYSTYTHDDDALKANIDAHIAALKAAGKA